MTEHEQAAQKVSELIDGIHIAMLTTVDAQGRLVSRPMGLQQLDDDGTLWFFTGDDADKADQVEERSDVNVIFNDDDTWVSIAGSATVTQDRERIHQLWNPTADAWFDGGPDSPEVALLRVDPDTAHYWTQESGRIGTVLEYVKAGVTGKRPDVGDSGSIDL